MTQEEKDLVLKDISARLYYGVKVSVPVVEKNMIFTVVGISESWLLVKNDRGSIFNVNTALEFKPYYRPMSSMTEEEKEELRVKNIIIGVSTSGTIETTMQGVDWLNKNMFDYRGLIERNLAIDCSNLNIYD